MKKWLLIWSTVFLLLISLVYGLTGISLDKIDFTSNDEELNKQAFLLWAVEDGSEQYAVGKFTADEINNKNDGKEKVTKDLTIKSNLIESKCSYSTIGQGETIYSAQKVFDDTFFWTEDATKKVQECESKGYLSGVRPEYQWYGKVARVVCIKKSPKAGYGTLRFDSYDFKDEITVAVEGESSQKLVLTNDNKKDSTDRVYVKWTGSLVTGKECPQPYAEDIRIAHVHDLSEGWRFIKAGNYEAYRIYDQSGFQNCLDNWNAKIIDDPNDCIELYNQKSNLAVSPTSYYDPSGIKLQFTSQNINWGSGTAFISVKNHLTPQHPTFLFRVDAEWMGLFLPVGMPKITKISSECFKEDAKGNIIIEIENVGNVDASFDVVTQCNYPFKAESINDIPVNKGRTEIINIPISGITQEAEFKSSCVIRVRDSEELSNYDQKEVTVCVKNAGDCGEKGDLKCENNIISICTDSGNWQEYKDCGNDGCAVRIDENNIEQYYCKGEGDKCSTTLECPLGQVCEEVEGVKRCVKKESLTGDTFWIIISAVAGLFAFGLFGLVFQKFTTKNFGPRYSWIGWVLGLLVGIVAGAMVWLLKGFIYMMLIALLILLVLYIIFWFFIGRKMAPFKKVGGKIPGYG